MLLTRSITHSLREGHLWIWFQAQFIETSREHLPSSMIKLCAFWQQQVSPVIKGSSPSTAVFLTNAVLYSWTLFFKRQNTRSFPFSLFLLNSICLQILRIIYYTTSSHVLIPHPQILGPSTIKSIELGFCDTTLKTGLIIFITNNVLPSFRRCESSYFSVTLRPHAQGPHEKFTLRWV